MSFRDYSLNPSGNTTLGDGTYIGPGMFRNKVRPAFQQIAADGKELADRVEDFIDGQADPLGQLRSDLAAPTGSTLILHKSAATGTFARSERQWAAVGGMDDANIFNWIDSGLDPGILDGSNTTNLAASVQAAIDHANGLGGGRAFAPRGTFYMGGTTLFMRPNMRWHGDHLAVSQFIWDGTGDGVKFAGNVNHSPSSSVERAYVSDLKLVCTNAANTGGAYVDVGGTYVGLDRLWISGFGYGAIFDQTELFDVDQCIIELQQIAAAWITDGPEHSAGASVAFSNRSSFRRTQINEAYTVNGIVDDGGYAHDYTDNNFNGCLIPLRVAAVLGLNIQANEFESASASPLVRLATTALSSGTGVGACHDVSIKNNLMLQSGGSSDIDIVGANGLEIRANYLNTNAGLVKITGSSNAIGLLDIGANTPADGRYDLILDGDPFQQFLTLANGANNDVALPAWAGPATGESWITIVGPTGAFSLTGLKAEFVGRVVQIYNGTGQTMTLANANTSSAGPNRIYTNTSADVSLPNRSCVTLRYHQGFVGWVVVDQLVGA